MILHMYLLVLEHDCDNPIVMHKAIDCLRYICGDQYPTTEYERVQWILEKQVKLQKTYKVNAGKLSIMPESVFKPAAVHALDKCVELFGKLIVHNDWKTVDITFLSIPKTYPNKSFIDNLLKSVNNEYRPFVSDCFAYLLS